jgi:hypothetical protein
MPPRFLSWTIVAFWLGTSSWLFVRDLRPRLFPSGPPPFTIDLNDEARSNIGTRWAIYRNGKDSGYCDTTVRQIRQDDTFELHGLFKLWLGPRGAQQADVVIESTYRVTRDGELRALRTKATAGLLGMQFEGRIEGKIENGVFAPAVTGEIKALQRMKFSATLDPVTVSKGGSVLNPLQPIHRLPGLRKGQRWEMPLVDPLSDLIYKYLKEVAGDLIKPRLRILHAEVAPTTQLLEWGDNHEQVPCLVIEYVSEDTTARTWVRESDGVVLRQEMKQDREEIILVRQ